MDIVALQLQKNMNREQKMMFQSQYENERVDPDTAVILAIFGFHYFYVGKVGLGVLFLITLGGLGIWWLIDLFRTKGMAERYNLDKAQQLATLVELY
jgi:TM2 domain-containing membrane protein YozV